MNHKVPFRLTINLHTSWCVIIPHSTLKALEELVSIDLEVIITEEENNHPSSEVIPNPPSIGRHTRIRALDSWNRML